MRIRIIKTTTKYKAGEVVDVSPNVAFGLLDSGIGVQSKDVTTQDVKGKKHGSAR